MNNTAVCDDVLDDDVLDDYLVETQERLDRIVSHLLEIESGDEVDLVGLKRELHTLKGLSGMVGFSDVSNLCHLMEDYLTAASAHGLDGAVQALLDGCDFISAHVDAIASGAAIPKTPESILARLRENTSEVSQERQQSVVALWQATDPCSDTSIDDSADDLDQSSARRMRYLIVDDNEANRELLLDILAKHGDCDVAENGEQAILRFRVALEGGQPYDAVCLDIMMPRINGHVTLETIRCIEHHHALYESSGVKVIMTTAAQGERHVVRAFKTGCQSYIAKPIEEPELFAAMQRLGVIESTPVKPVLRFRDDVTKVFVKTASGSTQAAEVVNESRIDINLLLEDVCRLRPSQEVDVMYMGVPMAAVIGTIDPQNEDGRYPICMVWK